MESLKIDYNNLYIKYIIQNIEDWKREYYLTNKYSLQYKSLEIKNSIVRWSYKNPKKIEFIIKNYSDKLKKTILQKLDKNDYSVKFVPITKDEYIIIVKMKMKICCTIC
jgi:hypothetical protein